jgi:glycosyltransferase involved in cell wall biosynthesis
MTAPQMTEPSSLDAQLSIVIPAYDEEEGIKSTLAGLTAQLPAAEIIVVDDGSRDRTLEVASEFENVVLVRHPFNRGYGAALKTGMTLASRNFVAWFDADNEHRVDDLVAMTRRLADEPVAAVIAQRQHPGVSPLRIWGKFVIRLLARSLSVQAVKDMNCGLRVFRREVITRYIPLLPNSFSASLTSLIVLLERGYPISFHPIQLNKRLGVSKVKLSDGFLALMLVLRILMLFVPMRIFLRVGFILVGIGVVYGTAVAIASGRGIPTLALGLVLSGVLAAFFGLTADQISQLRLAAYDQPIYRVVRRPPST